MKPGEIAARVILTTLIGAVLTYILFGMSNSPENTLKTIFNQVSNTNINWLISALILFVLSQILRAIRWRLVTFRRKIRMSLLFPLTSVHIGLGHILPLRISDLVYVALIRYTGAVPVGDGTASIAISKFLDIIAMGMVVGTVISLGISGKIVIIAPILITAGVCGIIFLPRILGMIYNLLCFFMRKKRERISQWYDDLQESLIIRKNLGRLFAALGISIITWICKLCMFSCLLISIGVSGIPLWKIFFASAMTDLTMALPIHGLFSVGTVETGWMAGFAIVGVDGLVEAGFSVHLLWISMAILLSILTLPWLFFAAGRQKSQKEND